MTILYLIFISFGLAQMVLSPVVIALGIFDVVVTSYNLVRRRQVKLVKRLFPFFVWLVAMVCYFDVKYEIVFKSNKGLAGYDVMIYLNVVGLPNILYLIVWLKTLRSSNNPAET